MLNNSMCVHEGGRERERESHLHVPPLWICLQNGLCPSEVSTVEPTGNLSLLFMARGVNEEGWGGSKGKGRLSAFVWSLPPQFSVCPIGILTPFLSKTRVRRLFLGRCNLLQSYLAGRRF